MESDSTKKNNSLLELKHSHVVPELSYPLDEDVVISYYLCRQVGSSTRIVHKACDYSEVRAIMDDRYRLNPYQDLFICKYVSSFQRLTL